jgi:hypothetical protein
MRLIALILIRGTSLLSGFVSLYASVFLALGVYAVVTVLPEFPDATPNQLGYVEGKLIGGPLLIALISGAVAYLLWRVAGRFRTIRQSNHQFQRTPDGAAE